MNAEQTVTAAKARSDFRPAFNKVNMRCISSLRRKRRSDYARKRQDNCNATDWEEDCGLRIADCGLRILLSPRILLLLTRLLRKTVHLPAIRNPQSAIHNPQSSFWWLHLNLKRHKVPGAFAAPVPRM